MKRIAVISDIHANIHALNQVAADLCSERINEVWFLGDLMGYGTNPRSCFECLENNIQPTIWLLGNHDLAFLGVEDQEIFNKMNLTAKKCILIHKEMANRSGYDQLKGKLNSLYNNQQTRCEYFHTSEIEGEKSKIKFICSHGVPKWKDWQSTITYDYEVAPIINQNNQNDPLILREEFCSGAQFWLVGHSHYQTAWKYDFYSNRWKMLLDQFGQQLEGNNHGASWIWIGPNGQPCISKPIRIPYKSLNEKDLILLNPGSIGNPRDGDFNELTRWHFAKYLRLDFTDSELICFFRLVPYNGEKTIYEWERMGFPAEMYQRFID